MDTSTDTIGTRIKALRARRRMTQLELAVGAGIMPAALSRIENDRVSPRLETLERIATALRVKPSRLIED